MKLKNTGKKRTKEQIENIRNSLVGRTLSREHIKRLRLAVIKRIEDRHGTIFPNYNIEACKIIEEYGKENGYNLQHAENGGEYYIKELGYFLDGYDKNKNVVIEYYERHHYTLGNLREKDLKRNYSTTWL